MKNLQELFTACGDDDRNEFKNIPEEFKPIDIALRVVPREIDLENKTVVLRVLINSHVEDIGLGHVLHNYEIDLELPIHAIELIPKPSD